VLCWLQQVMPLQLLPAPPFGVHAVAAEFARLLQLQLS
jgi:hypothetical protein